MYNLGRNTSNAVRLAEVVGVFAKHGFADLLRRAKFEKSLPAKMLRGMNLMEAPSGTPATFGERLRAALVELGPTFIKFGQILSTRPDLVDHEVAKQLSRLQDNVTPLPFELMVAVFKEDVGKELDEVFAIFDKTPVASASIGQVYKAQLHTGEMVAVKIQRPGVAKIIESDLSLLLQMAEWLQEHAEDAAWLNPVGVVGEFTRSIRRELDYTIEARIVEQFLKNFEGDEFVIIPAVYREASGSKVLTLEWVDGVRADTLGAYPARNSDPQIVAELGCEALFKMIFEHHLFHADPHPGNIFLTQDNKLAFLDFGMAGHLQPSDTGALADLFISIFRKDAAATVNAALLLSINGAPENRDMLEQEVAEFIAFEAEAIINSGHVAKGLERAVEILRHHNIQLTPRFAMLIKALATIEVVGRTLNPKMDVVPLMQPFLEKLISERYQPLHVMREMTHNTSTLIKLTRQLPADLSLLLHQLNQGRLSVRYKNEDQDRMINAIDLAGTRIAMALSLAGVLLASSMLFEHGPPLSRIGAVGYIVAIGIGAYLGMSILWRKP